MLRTIAFVLIMTLGIGAALVSRFGALLLYLWFALFRPQEWLWVDITGLHLSLVVGLILVVPALISGNIPNITHPLNVGALLFLLLGLLAQTAAVRPDVGWQWLDFMARLILVGLLLVRMVETKRRFVLTVAVMAGSFGYHPAKAGLVSIIGGGVQYFEGLSGAFADNNGYALGTVMIVPLLFAAGQNLPKSSLWQRGIGLGFLLSVPFSAFTVVSLSSRGAFVGLAAATVVFVALQKRRFVAALVVVLCVAAAAPLISARYLARLDTIRSYDEVQDTSALGRLHFWRVAVEMAEQHPLGVGLFNFAEAYDAHDSSGGRYGPRRAAHSSHFQVLAELGFAGAALWVGLFIVAFGLTWRIRQRARAPGLSEADSRFLFTMANGLLASMSGFVVGGAFLSLALNDLTWLTFALVAALDRLSTRIIAGEATDRAIKEVLVPAGVGAS